jgi:NAD(P)-dependent dehydrogenase (short-subunit alcohol dehydrogenase family)
VACALADSSATVYATGRTVAATSFGRDVRTLPCDHRDDAAVARAFTAIGKNEGRLDLLVNCVWGGYENMVEHGRFTWPAPFWEQPIWRWDAMVTAGVRAAYVASQLAARIMIPARRGLIVHLSHWAAQKYVGNVVYGIAKIATDKMAADIAHELRPHAVTVVSLYPGLVRTEAVLAAGVFDLSNSESPEFVGRAVAALATDPNLLRRSGQVLIAAALGSEYGFSDVDGRQPRPLTLADGKRPPDPALRRALQAGRGSSMVLAATASPAVDTQDARRHGPPLRRGPMGEQPPGEPAPRRDYSGLVIVGGLVTVEVGILYVLIALETPLTPLVHRLLGNPGGVLILVGVVLLILIIGMITLLSWAERLHRPGDRDGRGV